MQKWGLKVPRRVKLTMNLVKFRINHKFMNPSYILIVYRIILENYILKPHLSHYLFDLYFL